jgi:hypothetical protein
MPSSPPPIRTLARSLARSLARALPLAAALVLSGCLVVTCRV